MTLAEDVLARHVSFRSLGEDHCLACSDSGPEGEYAPWPCDAYRLAVMVRDIEALCEREGEYMEHNWIEGPALVVRVADILAITKGDVT